MNLKIVTRNKNTLPVIFCTTGNFLNLKKMKFIPKDKAIKSDTKKNSKKNSLTNLSQTISNKEKNKDQIIKQLKERIQFLEYKIKILEKEKEISQKTKKNSLSKTLILRNNSFKIFNEKNKVATIPLDKNLLKTKLCKKKKNILDIFDVKHINKKNKTNSFNLTDLSITKNKKHKSKHNSIITTNNSISNYYTNNNSTTGSALKPKKKSITINAKGNTIDNIHNLLYGISSKTTKSKGSSIEFKKNSNFGGIEKKIGTNPGRKINAIPKKGRKNCNASPKVMMSSTNYSNNISNSFKEEVNVKKDSPKKVNNISNNNNTICDKISFNDIKNKLENIQIRTKNLLGFYSSINFIKNDLYKNNINKEKVKCGNYSHYIKISKVEKLKKD